MRAWNKKKKPKHTTRCKYKLGEAVFKYSKRMALHEKVKEECLILLCRQYITYNIPKYCMTFAIV